MTTLRDDVGTEQDASLPLLEEVRELTVFIPGQLSHHPFRGAGIQMQIRMSFQQSVQDVQSLRPTPHVRGNPRRVESVQRLFQRDVLVRLGAVP